MCMGGGGSPKVEVPKPPPLPPPLPAPPPPVAESAKKQSVVKNLEMDKPDIRIGAAKTERPSTGRPRTSTSGRGNKSLSIGTNQGLSL